jgi:phosphoglycolate phosphatase-like HAD superfamily hydrolase
LHRRGVTLYLASGTDQGDVIEEAQALGYAEFFEGRIFGAVKDAQVDAKRMILERIIAEHGLSGHQFAMFGDGPLEIRETRKRDGIAVGVASDEAKAAGVNLSKRKRLVRAGADLIIPDYGSWQRLLELLQL